MWTKKSFDGMSNREKEEERLMEEAVDKAEKEFKNFLKMDKNEIAKRLSLSPIVVQQIKQMVRAHYDEYLMY
jgi:uncharacterized membrane protein YheB (UPF0754 family)